MSINLNKKEYQYRSTLSYHDLSQGNLASFAAPCGASKFTCDGTCHDISLKCNGKDDCQDKTDEETCGIYSNCFL